MVASVSVVPEGLRRPEEWIVEAAARDGTVVHVGAWAMGRWKVMAPVESFGEALTESTPPPGHVAAGHVAAEVEVGGHVDAVGEEDAAEEVGETRQGDESHELRQLGDEPSSRMLHGEPTSCGDRRKSRSHDSHEHAHEQGGEHAHEQGGEHAREHQCEQGSEEGGERQGEERGEQSFEQGVEQGFEQGGSREARSEEAHGGEVCEAHGGEVCDGDREEGDAQAEESEFTPSRSAKRRIQRVRHYNHVIIHIITPPFITSLTIAIRSN